MSTQKYSLEISEYTSELKKLVTLSKLIVTKDQQEADIFEQDVIADTITFNYQDNQENWVKANLFVGLNQNVNTINAEKYWVEYMVGMDNPYNTIAINTATQELWVRITPTLWRESFSGRVAPTASTDWVAVAIPKGIMLTYDLFKGIVFTSSTVWYEKTSGRTSAVLPTEVTPATGVNKTHPEGLSDLISTPEEYITAMYQLQANSELTQAERDALEDAVANFKADGIWEDVRISMYQRDAGGFLLLGADGLPINNPDRFKTVPFRGEKNTYYRRLVADHSIDPFLSRTTGDFEILSFQYLSNTPKELTDQFIDIYRQNIQVFKHTIYNQAFKQQESYRSWCSYYINWMTLMRYESTKISNVHDIDLMDERDVTNALYSASLFEFDDIPLVYKRRIVKATERLLSRKGTSQVFNDILSLFNLDKDVNLLKYYLVKHYPSSLGILEVPDDMVSAFKTGDSFAVTFSDGTIVTAPFDTSFTVTFSKLITSLQGTGHFNVVELEEGSDDRILYSLKSESVSISSFKVTHAGGTEEFAEMRISEQPDWFRPDIAFLETDINARSIQEGVGTGFNTSKLRDFENFISKDPKWQASREELLKKNFSTIQSKYFSVSTAIDVVTNGVAVSFLWGMLKQYQTTTSRENMNILNSGDIPGVSSITFFEAMIGMLCLTLWKHGVSDIIPHEAAGVEAIVGLKYTDSVFPNESNLVPFASKTVLPTSGTVITPTSVTTAVDDNLEIYKNIQRYVQGFTAPVQSTALKYVMKTNGEAYQDYAHMRDVQAMNSFKFTATAQYDCFNGFNTYSDYLENKNPEFRQWLDSYDTEAEYNNGILILTTLVENAIDTENFSFSLGTGINTLILDYVERMIRFFKSYTVDLKEINTYMQIDDPNFESLHLMNVIKSIGISSHYKDKLALKDWNSFENHTEYSKDELMLIDEVFKVMARIKAKSAFDLVDKLGQRRMNIGLQEYVPGVDSQLCWDVLKSWRDNIKGFDRLMTRDFYNNFATLFKINTDKFTFADVKMFTSGFNLNRFSKLVKSPMKDTVKIKVSKTVRECLAIETQNHEEERTVASFTDRLTISSNNES